MYREAHDNSGLGLVIEIMFFNAGISWEELMQSKVKTVLLAAACSLLPACATGYVEPPSTVSHAKFTFKKVISGKLLFRGEEPTIVTYQTYTDTACKQPVPAANFSPISAVEKVLRFEANIPQRMIVNVVTKTGDLAVQNGVVVPSGPIEQHNCIGMAKFTPIPGQTYELSASATDDAEACILEIIDKDSGKPPADIVRTKQEICDS